MATASAAQVAVRNMEIGGIDPANPQGRPPLVRFELRPVEDRDASIKAGHFVGRDVAHILVTPRGSKDVHEDFVDAWLEKTAQQVREGLFPAIWLEAITQRYEMWKKGVEGPADGSSLKSWPPIRPSQLRTCHELGLFTVEDLADANEQTLMGIGIGARQLKESAKLWLKASKDTGVAVAEVEALRVKNAHLETRLEKQAAQIDALLLRMETLQAAAAVAGVNAGPRPAMVPKGDIEDALSESIGNDLGKRI